MRMMISWRRSALGLAVALFGLTASQVALSQQDMPDDTTQGLRPTPEDPADPDMKAPIQDKPTSRLEWQRKAWGVVTPTYRQNAMKEGKGHSNKKNAKGPKWINIGPTGADFQQNGSFTGRVRDSGRARAVLPHPTNADVVYLLTSGGGLWRSNNWTSPNTQWDALTDDLPTTGGGSVAFGSNPNTLYLGLGDAYDQVLVGGSVVKSTNGGNTWGPVIELGNAVSVRDVKVDTSTNRDIAMVATDSGLYRSSDEGASYLEVPTFSGMSVWSIARTSAGWLASAQPCPAAFVGLRCGAASTLYLSTDRGATWAPIPNAGNVFSANGRTTLAVGLPGDSVVYAYSSTVADTALRDVYRSTDGGRTWTANGVNATKAPTNPVAGAMADMNICHAQCWYNQMVVVDPRDASRNTVWIGGDLATAQSTDGGASWTIKTWWLYSQVPELPYAHADHHAAAFKLTGTPAIILGNDGGLHVSEDGGATFSSDKNNGLVSHLYYTVTGNAQIPSLVLGGTQDNGTRLRVGTGTIHNQVIGGDGMGTAYSQANTNAVLGSSQGSGMRTNLSNNPPLTFQNWAAATSGLSDPAGFGFFTAIVPAPSNLDATGKVFFHFSASRVWKTVNGGLTWTRIASATASAGVAISPGLPSTRRFRSSPYNLGVSPTDLNRIAVGAGGGFIDITTDGGATWTDINLVAKVPGYVGFVTNMTWQDNQNLWITSSAQAPGAVRVIKASIATPGSSWATATFTPLQTGLPDLPVTRVYVDPRDPSGSVVYAATHVGLYRTLDSGVSWESYSAGLPTVRINDMYMPPDGAFIRVATYGRGIWELPQLEVVGTSLADSGGKSCDNDGVLDNGETGRLNVTLRNYGPNNISKVSMTVTSTNPNVTFPDGNTAKFPPVQKNGESSGFIRVALNGATLAETADFKVAISAEELGLPGPLTTVATYRVNYDDKPATSAVETVESNLENNGWTIMGTPTEGSPNIAKWQRRALSPTRHVWWGPDNNGQTDGVRGDLPDEQVLVSPALQVGSGPLTIAFSHRFSFENGGWDGGVVELSQDNGATWVDIGTSAYNGATRPDTSAPIGSSRPAFVNRIVGWPNFANVALNLGTAYANQQVRLRFRIGADDSTGAPGWDVDDINVGGITNTPFAALVPNALVCGAP